MLTSILPLIGVGVGFVLASGRDVIKDWRQGRKKKRGVRRLLAHHAATLAEDAQRFLAIAEPCVDLSETEVAGRFADVTTSEHVYGAQIAARVDDLSDDLIELFRDLDLTAQGAAHSVAVLQRWAATFYGVRDASRSTSGSGRSMPTALGAMLRDAIDRYRSLLVTALATLQCIDRERTDLPANAARLLTPPSVPSALPPGK